MKENSEGKLYAIIKPDVKPGTIDSIHFTSEMVKFKSLIIKIEPSTCGTYYRSLIQGEMWGFSPKWLEFGKPSELNEKLKKIELSNFKKRLIL